MELLFEIIVEVFGELIIWIIGAIFSGLYDIFDEDGTSKKRIKNISAFMLFGLVIGLLIYAIFTKKGLYIRFVLGYLIIMYILRIGSFIGRNYSINKLQGFIRVIQSIIHYCFAVSVIWLASIEGVTDGEVVIIIFSIIGIAAFLTLDIFRIIKRCRRRRREKMRYIN